MPLVSVSQRTGRVLLAAASAIVLVPCAGVGVAAASTTGSGGMSFEKPGLEKLSCADGRVGECPRGGLLRLKGKGLDKTSVVRFAGGKGTADDRVARPIARSAHRVVVKVPRSARSGSVIAVTRAAALRGPTLTVLPAAPAPAPTAIGGTTPVALENSVFPLTTKHSFGTSVNGFGGGRGHQGQDILARCGVPIVAALGGKVQRVAFEGAAGNYVVIDTPSGTSQAYMHLRERSVLRKGDTVLAGDRVGDVGQTGRASACHLHFEYWTAPGWYKGGKPIDPLPLLRSWDRPATASAARP